jgi:alcohol dehydrogenase class IV
VIFAAGARARTAEELDRLKINRAIVLSTPQQAELAAEFSRDIGDRAAVVYPGATMHTPVEVTEAALDAARAVEANGILSVGGGSTTGLGKAIALRTDLPQLVIPTTFAGSEMTPILGQTERGAKTTLRSMKVLPETVIYDPDLVVGMPLKIAGPSGMNAIAHSIEALYPPDTSPLYLIYAEESIRALAHALPEIMENSGDGGAWEGALYGAWLAGLCLGGVGMALHHKICHTLGGSFNLDHAGIHCLMLPYTAVYNREAAPEAMKRAGRAMGQADAAAALYRLSQQLGIYKNLRDCGLSEADLDRASDLAAANPYWNPRPVERGAIRAMLQQAYEGIQP